MSLFLWNRENGNYKLAFHTDIITRECLSLHLMKRSAWSTLCLLSCLPTRVRSFSEHARMTTPTCNSTSGLFMIPYPRCVYRWCTGSRDRTVFLARDVRFFVRFGGRNENAPQGQVKIFINLGLFQVFEEPIIWLDRNRVISPSETSRYNLFVRLFSYVIGKKTPAAACWRQTPNWPRLSTAISNMDIDLGLWDVKSISLPFVENHRIFIKYRDFFIVRHLLMIHIYIKSLKCKNVHIIRKKKF